MVTVVKGWYHIDSVANTEGGVWVVVDGEAKPDPKMCGRRRLYRPKRRKRVRGNLFR
jgi:hypothetical protein